METVPKNDVGEMVLLFKSYYVVWKLQEIVAKNPGIIKFKSYYVVWKHRHKICEHMDERCLNRTM